MKRLMWTLLLGVGVLGAQQVVSIYDIQYTTDPSGDSPYVGQTVTTFGIVTGVFGDNLVFIEERPGGAWHGILIYRGNNTTPAVQVGDSLQVTGEVAEYYNMTEINTSSGSITVLASGLTPPGPTLLATGEVSQEMYEGVFVRVENATCTEMPNQYGEWYVDDGSGPVQIDDLGVPYTPQIGARYNIQGPVRFSYGEFEIDPRTEEDIEYLGGGQNMPPQITNIGRIPGTPGPDEAAVVFADITDESAVTGDALYYALNSPTGFTQVSHDSVVGHTYYYTLPGQPLGTQVFYFLWAQDDSGATTVTDTFSYTVMELPPVKINEVMYDLANDGSQGPEPFAEWIELYNAGSQDVDLSGWILTDINNPDTTYEGRFVLPSGTVIPAGGFVVLTHTADSFLLHFSVPAGVPLISYGVGDGDYLRLSNAGDDVHLFLPDGTEVDAVWYGSGGQMGSTNAAPDVDPGQSLARYPDGHDTDVPALDFQAADSLTPGWGNYVAVAEGQDPGTARLTVQTRGFRSLVFTLPHRSAYRVALYDIAGREVLRRQGVAQAVRLTPALPTGVYLYRIEADGLRAHGTFVLVR